MIWRDIEEIAEALEENYPDEDLDNLDLEHLQNLIVSLPEFCDNMELMDLRILREIIDYWISIKN